MKIEVITNGIKSYADIPVNWDQVAFEQFLNLPDDKVKVISLFTGVDEETLAKSKIVNFDMVMDSLSFLNTQPTPRIPETLLGYAIPKNLEFEQVQMYLDIKNYLDETKELDGMGKLRQYTMYCAVYSCIAKHGKYDWKLAEAMQNEFLKAPCTEVMGIGHFTLLRLAGLKHSTPIDFRLPVTRMTKFRLALKGFQLRMGQYLRSLILKKKLI